jgi:hypothetical protein
VVEFLPPAPHWSAGLKRIGADASLVAWAEGYPTVEAAWQRTAQVDRLVQLYLLGQNGPTVWQVRRSFVAVMLTAWERLTNGSVEVPTGVAKAAKLLTGWASGKDDPRALAEAAELSQDAYPDGDPITSVARGLVVDPRWRLVTRLAQVGRYSRPVAASFAAAAVRDFAEAFPGDWPHMRGVLRAWTSIPPKIPQS